MSLLSLKKPTLSCECISTASTRDQSWDVDDFIAGAAAYAAGERNVVPFRSNQLHEHCKRATFTLTRNAIEQLAVLSQQTGIPKSRLIRIWLDNIDWQDDLDLYLTSSSR